MPQVIGFIATTASSAWAGVSAWVAGLGTIGTAALQLTGNLALAALSTALQRRRLKQSEIKRELPVPTSRPVARTAFGRTKIPGTPAPWRKKGDVLYGCLILNSHSSAGTNPEFWFDGRKAQQVSGDLLDFDVGALFGPVAEDHDFGAGDNRPRLWLGLGDQTSPPAQILTEAAEEFLASDGWRGLTVLWVRIGGWTAAARTDRWPGTVPEIEVLADWSKVWDPRDEAQDPHDPATWVWSRNNALCALHARRFNPIAPLPLDMFALPTFIWGADVADERVPLKAGGDVMRYAADGLIVWAGGDVEAQITPLADAGAGEFVSFNGLCAYSPGAARTPAYTITDFLEEAGLTYQAMAPQEDVPVAIQCSYIAPDRDWQEASLPPALIRGGSVESGLVEVPLPFVTEPTQAMRIQKIMKNRAAAQRRLTLTLPPDAINLVPGAVAAWGIPDMARYGGGWRVQAADPAITLDEEGVAARVRVTLAEEPDDLHAWTPETDEYDLVDEAYVPPGVTRDAPVVVSAAQDGALIGFLFEPASDAVVYEWQVKLGGGDWRAGGLIDAALRDGDDVPGQFMPPESGVWALRVRALFLGSAFSAWAEFDPVTFTAPAGVPEWADEDW